MISSPYRVDPDRKSPLKRVETDDTGPFKCQEDAAEGIEENRQQIAALQTILYAEGKRSLLVVLQGMDTSGKDGTIRHVFSGVNPQGCSVASFKAPSALELGHDYLWRYHLRTPARGMITIFNRSHYESVLVERVHGIAPKEVWSERYEQINEFERMLSSEGTMILKCFLHISRKEQKERLEKRLADPDRNWKFDVQDLKERELWKDYQEAYEDALLRCSTKRAPWYIIPADKKWFRNWLVSDLIRRALESMDLHYPPPMKGIRRWKVK